MRRKLVIWIPLICLLLLTSVTVKIPRTCAVDPANMYASPSAVIDESLTTGTTFWVDFNITNAHDLHTWQIRLHYDPAVVLPSGLVWGDFLNGSARAGAWGILLQDAPAGDYNVTVSDPTKFMELGCDVLIEDDNNWEVNIVTGVDLGSCNVTMYYPLQHTYTVAANAVCSPWPPITNAMRNRPTEGYITMGQATEGAFPGQEGDGWLNSLRFTVQSYGRCKLMFDTVDSWYMDSNLIKQTVADGHLTLSDGYFSNMIPGDMIGDTPASAPDGDVDMYDLGEFADAYGSHEGEPEYNELADLIGDTPGSAPDGDVDMYDLGVFADNYGRSI